MMYVESIKQSHRWISCLVFVIVYMYIFDLDCQNCLSVRDNVLSYIIIFPRLMEKNNFIHIKQFLNNLSKRTRAHLTAKTSQSTRNTNTDNNNADDIQFVIR